MQGQFRYFVIGISTVAGLAFGLTQNIVAAVCLFVFIIISTVVWKLKSSDHVQWRYPIFIGILTLSSVVYGWMTEANNRTSLPHHLEEHTVSSTGIIVSPVKIDGDRVSFQLKVKNVTSEQQAVNSLPTSTDDHRRSLIDDQDVYTAVSSIGDSTSVSESTTIGQVEITSDKVSTGVTLRSIYDTTYETDEVIQTTIYLDSEEELLEITEWTRGVELTLTGELRKPGTARNFGDFDYRSYLHQLRIHWTLTVDGLQAVDYAAQPKFHINTLSLSAMLDTFRDRLSALVQTLYGERYAGFMQGLLIGDRSELPQDIYEQFSDIGMTHVLAISGLHVNVFIAGCFWLLRLLRLKRTRVYMICFTFIPLYVLCTGAAPSAIRAGLMAMLGLVAIMRGRWKDSLRYIMIAAIIMLIWNPYYLYHIGFQLSFVVTIGLVTVVPKLTTQLPIRPIALAGALAVTIVAQIYSFPLVIYYFHTVHILSPAANMVLVPLVSVIILPVGMLSLLLGAVHPILGQLPAKLCNFITERLFQAVEWTSAQDTLQMSWPRVPVWWIVLYFIIVAFLFSYGPRLRAVWTSRPQRGLILTLSAALGALFIYGYAGDHWDREGIVSVLDVGQGDAILIRTPQGKHILVDGGGTFRFTQDDETWRMRKDPYEVGKDLLVPLLRRRGIHQLDAIVVSHFDADHIGGLHAVVENIPTARILFNSSTKESPYADRLIAAALERKIPLSPVTSGMTWQIEQSASITFLHPFEQPDLQSELPILSDQNAHSVVFLLQMYDTAFLLTGDIGMKEEREIIHDLHESDDEFGLLLSANRPKIDMLKIAHHGSRHSTSVEWLKYWQPKTSAISVGRNSYGHPAQDVIERLDDYAGVTYRTDQHGEIQYAASGGDQLEVRTKFIPEE